jgi:hypothetical protein
MRDLHPGRLQRLQPVQDACVNWQPHAMRLAAQVTHPGPADEHLWLDAAYADRSLVT